MNESGRRRGTSAAAMDLMIICLGAVAAFALAIRFEAFGRFAAWIATHNQWFVDDAVIVLVFLGFATGVFSWRRRREFAAEVSRRRIAEESLGESEESCRRIVEQADEIIYRTDPQGRFIFCNPTSTRILKYAESELLGLHFQKLIRPDQREAAAEFYKHQFLNRTASTYYEFTAVTKDGQEVLLAQNVQMLSADGMIVGFQAVARDITERKQSEKALRKLEEYRNLFQLANDAILILDNDDGTVLAVNDKACEAYGIARDKFIGCNLRDVTQDANDTEHRFEGVNASRPLENEAVHIRPDGSLINFLISTSLIEYHGRDAILSINRDITKRKRAEEQLRESEASYHRLVEMSPDGIIVHRDGLVEFVNRAGLKLIGAVSEAAVIGKSLFDLVRPEYRESMRERVGRLQRGERLPPAEVKVTRLDGIEIDCEVLSAPFTHNNQPAVQVVVRDITERKRAEQALRESEDNFERIVEISPDAIMVHRDGIIEFVNNAAVKMIGATSSSELIGQSVYYRIPLAYREFMTERVSRLQQGEFPPSVEIKLTRLDDTEIDCEVLSVPFRRGDHFAVQVIARDITERKRAEQKQNRLQGERDQLLEQLQLQMDFMPIAFLLTDADFRTTYWNPAAERIFGFTKEEVLGNYGHHLIVPPDSHEFVAEIFERVAAGESLSSSFGENVAKDGRRITCEWYTTSLRKADGTFVGMMSMAQDVTEQKQATDSLQEANERALTDYERLVERIAALGQTLGSARDLNIIFRALRDFAALSVPCDGLIISIYNEAKETRKPAYLWTDEKEFDLTDAADTPVRDGSAGRAIKSGKVIIDNDFQQHLREMPTPPTMVGEFGEGQTPQSALIAPMTMMGRTVGSVEIQSYQTNAYSEDHAAAMRLAANMAGNAVENVALMEREQAKEEQLRQSQKMEAIGQLAGGVAHDFNNLLTVITGYSEMSLNRMLSDDPLRNNVEQILKAGVRAAGLTRQLLAFSRRQMLQAKVLDLNSVVQDMNTMLQRLIGEDIELATFLRSSLAPIKADPGQLEQVLLNLVVNARDAMPKGGKITIETGHALLNDAYVREHLTVRPGSYVVLTVSDTGSGMDTETQKQIFDPFFTTKGVGKGTGLGLSTVYGIVKQSEGSISVHSEPNMGTTFKIYLPRVDEVAEVVEVNSSSQDTRGGSETILLVEDEELVRKLAVVILKDYGYTVLAAASGEEGLRICRDFNGPIDLMITDVVMPKMSGRELAEQFTVLRPKTSVLYMSGYTDDSIVRHGILEESMAFIQKPFLPEALALKARALLDLPTLQQV